MTPIYKGNFKSPMPNEQLRTMPKEDTTNDDYSDNTGGEDDPEISDEDETMQMCQDLLDGLDEQEKQCLLKLLQADSAGNESLDNSKDE